jgi:hypothetical protein
MMVIRTSRSVKEVEEWGTEAVEEWRSGGVEEFRSFLHSAIPPLLHF